MKYYIKQKNNDNSKNKEIIFTNKDEYDERFLDYIVNKKVIPRHLQVYHNNIIGFSCNGDKYILNEDIELVKQLVNNLGLKYKGQSIGELLKNYC